MSNLALELEIVEAEWFIAVRRDYAMTLESPGPCSRGRPGIRIFTTWMQTFACRRRERPPSRLGGVIVQHLGLSFKGAPRTLDSRGSAPYHGGGAVDSVIPVYDSWGSDRSPSSLVTPAIAAVSVRTPS